MFRVSQFLLIFFVSPLLALPPVNYVGRRPNYECQYEERGFGKCSLVGIEMNSSLSHFGLFLDPSHVQDTRIVEVRDSVITNVNNIFCRTFPNLEEIRILNVQVGQISEDALLRCNNLKVFELNEVNTTYLERKLFSGAPNLVQVSIGNTNIWQLPLDIFDPLVYLKYLKLYFNELVEFPARLFENLAQLEELSLVGNDILDVNEKLVLQFLPNLKRINVQHNNLLCSRVDKIFRTLQPRGITFDTQQLTTEQKVREKYRTQNVASVQNIDCLNDPDWLQLKSHSNFIVHEANSGLTKGEDKQIIHKLVHENDRKYQEIMSRVQDAETKADLFFNAARNILGA